MVRELVAYGEPEAAVTLMQLDSEAVAAIGVTLCSARQPHARRRHICGAVVELIEGGARPLRRKRRVYPERRR